MGLQRSKGKYFGRMRPPRGGGINKLSKISGEEIRRGEGRRDGAERVGGERKGAKREGVKREWCK